MTSPAACGFPSPADDYMDRPLDFNELLIANEAATFAMRIAGESMTGAGRATATGKLRPTQPPIEQSRADHVLKGTEDRPFSAKKLWS